MRARIRRALLQQFEREFERRFPQFKRIKSRSQSPIWAWQIAPDLTFFVMLDLLERDDQFVVETAWSENGEFPWGGLSHSSRVDEPRWRNRLARLWASGNEASIWDLAPEKTAAREAALEAMRRGESPAHSPDPPVNEVLPRVPSLVDDAVQKLGQYGLPLFRRVADHRGIKWPLQEGSTAGGSHP